MEKVSKSTIESIRRIVNPLKERMKDDRRYYALAKHLGCRSEQLYHDVLALERLLRQLESGLADELQCAFREDGAE